jgi:hypothetical protein
MRIPEIYNKVEEAGEIRAYWAAKDDTFHYGERGDLTIRNEELVFISELEPDSPIIVDFNDEVHIPRIGHYVYGLETKS